MSSALLRSAKASTTSVAKKQLASQAIAEFSKALKSKTGDETATKRGLVEALLLRGSVVLAYTANNPDGTGEEDRATAVSDGDASLALSDATDAMKYATVLARTDTTSESNEQLMEALLLMIRAMASGPHPDYQSAGDTMEAALNVYMGMMKDKNGEFAALVDGFVTLTWRAMVAIGFYSRSTSSERLLARVSVFPAAYVARLASDKERKAIRFVEAVSVVCTAVALNSLNAVMLKIATRAVDVLVTPMGFNVRHAYAYAVEVLAIALVRNAQLVKAVKYFDQGLGHLRKLSEVEADLPVFVPRFVRIAQEQTKLFVVLQKPQQGIKVLEEAVEYERKLLASTTTADKATHLASLAAVLTQLGELLVRSNVLERSAELMSEAIGVLRELREAHTGAQPFDVFPLCKALFTRAQALQNADKFEDALRIYDEAFLLAKSVDMSIEDNANTVASAYLNCANINVLTNADLAIENNLRALTEFRRLAARLPTYRYQVAFVLDMLRSVYQDEKRYDEALASAEECVEIARTVGQNTSANIVNAQAFYQQTQHNLAVLRRTMEAAK